MLDRRFLDKPVFLEVSMGSAGNVLEASGGEDNEGSSASSSVDGSGSGGSGHWEMLKWKSTIKNHSTTPTVKAVAK